MKSSTPATGAKGKPKETEAGFSRAVMQAAKALGWHPYHTWLSVRSERGFPDLVLVKPGEVVIYAELKTDRGVVTKAQDTWLQSLRLAVGTEVYVWRPSDFDDIVRRLRGCRGNEPEHKRNMEDSLNEHEAH